MNTKRRDNTKASGVGPNGRALCSCGCGREVQGRRISWFSDECVRLYLIKSDPAVARHNVELRDKEVCQECRFDCRALEMRIIDFKKRFKRNFNSKRREDFVERMTLAFNRFIKTIPPDWQSLIKLHRNGNWAWIEYRHLWEMDHIVPVVEGGGGCGLDNLRTLCIPCHRKATAALRRRLAEKKDKTPLLL